MIKIFKEMININTFTEWSEKRNLKPLALSNKARYYMDLSNIENSITGRIDVMFANTFILESSQLVINAITLFEQGYFDCAYYSLRESIEVATTIIYLIELDPDKRKEKLKDWEDKGKFPMAGQMKNYLNNNEDIYHDISQKMKLFFEGVKKAEKKMNKIVHKQGFDTFYISRNHPMNHYKDYKEDVNIFNEDIEICIGLIAVLRLAIDPFPVLLMDEEIYLRTEDLLTLRYTEEFIDRYIGMENIEEYKNTKIYKTCYDDFIKSEKKLTCVADVIKDHCIDKKKIGEILSQSHLLDENSLVAVCLSAFSEKVAKIYCESGFFFYFTSTQTIRTTMSWDQQDFIEFEKKDKKDNLSYDEAFITIRKINNKNYFIEHNEKFSENELSELNKSIENPES